MLRLSLFAKDNFREIKDTKGTKADISDYELQMMMIINHYLRSTRDPDQLTVCLKEFRSLLDTTKRSIKLKYATHLPLSEGEGKEELKEEILDKRSYKLKFSLFLQNLIYLVLHPDPVYLETFDENKWFIKLQLVKEIINQEYFLHCPRKNEGKYWKDPKHGFTALTSLMLTYLPSPLLVEPVLEFFFKKLLHSVKTAEELKTYLDETHQVLVKRNSFIPPILLDLIRVANNEELFLLKKEKVAVDLEKSMTPDQIKLQQYKRASLEANKILKEKEKMIRAALNQLEDKALLGPLSTEDQQKQEELQTKLAEHIGQQLEKRKKERQFREERFKADVSKHKADGSKYKPDRQRHAYSPRFDPLSRRNNSPTSANDHSFYRKERSSSRGR